MLYADRYECYKDQSRNNLDHKNDLFKYCNCNPQIDIDTSMLCKKSNDRLYLLYCSFYHMKLLDNRCTKLKLDGHSILTLKQIMISPLKLTANQSGCHLLRFSEEFSWKLIVKYLETSLLSVEFQYMKKREDGLIQF